MARPYDGQSEVLWNIRNLLDDPDLTTEELAKIVVTIQSFVASQLLSDDDAHTLLSERIISTPHDLILPTG